MLFELQLKEQLTKELELAYQDLADSRDLQKEALRQNDTFSKRFIYFLSIGILLNVMLAGVLAFFYAYPESNRELVNYYYSFTFMTGAMQMVRFYFGSNPNPKITNNE